MERPNISPGIICFIKVKVIPEETFDEKCISDLEFDLDNDLQGELCFFNSFVTISF